jgi:hypothetical protein
VYVLQIKDLARESPSKNVSRIPSNSARAGQYFLGLVFFTRRSHPKLPYFQQFSFGSQRALHIQ